MKRTSPSSPSFSSPRLHSRNASSKRTAVACSCFPAGVSGRAGRRTEPEHQLPQRARDPRRERRPIFWGPSATWGTASSPSALTQHIVGFFTQFGTNPQYRTITQYYDMSGSIQLSNLTNHVCRRQLDPTDECDGRSRSGRGGEWWPRSWAARARHDLRGLPAAELVCDLRQLELLAAAQNLQFCAYHSNFVSSGIDIKYASMPYPSCSGCQWRVGRRGRTSTTFRARDT
jgi:hypothetical protein